MLKRHICLHGSHPWCVDIVYDATARDTDYILDILDDMGCPVRAMKKAHRLLKSGVPNEGLTYSDSRHRRSIVVVGHATSVGEFIDTLAHELNHLTDHISQYYGVDLDSEENAYLMGDIAKIVFEDAVQWATHRYLL